VLSEQRGVVDEAFLKASTRRPRRSRDDAAAGTALPFVSLSNTDDDLMTGRPRPS